MAVGLQPLQLGNLLGERQLSGCVRFSTAAWRYRGFGQGPFGPGIFQYAGRRDLMQKAERPKPFIQGFQAAGHAARVTGPMGVVGYETGVNLTGLQIFHQGILVLAGVFQGQSLPLDLTGF